MSKVKSFYKQAKALLKGDEEGVIIEKNYRKITAGIKGQLTSLEGKMIDAETELEEAQENLIKVVHNPQAVINDIAEYFKKVKVAKDLVEDAENKIKQIKESEEWFKKLELDINAEVEE